MKNEILTILCYLATLLVQFCPQTVHGTCSRNVRKHAKVMKCYTYNWLTKLSTILIALKKCSIPLSPSSESGSIWSCKNRSCSSVRSISELASSNVRFSAIWRQLQNFVCVLIQITIGYFGKTMLNSKFDSSPMQSSF